MASTCYDSTKQINVYVDDLDFTGRVKGRPNARLTEGVTMHLGRPRNNAYLGSISYMGSKEFISKEFIRH